MRSLFERFWKYLDSKFGIPKKDRHRALPMRLIPDEDNLKEYCWEDWHAEMKAKYPIRHWIFQEFNIWFSVKYMILVEDPIYNFKSKFITKAHLIDLRGAPIGTYEKEYKGGYISFSDTIELGTYKAFKKFTDSLQEENFSINSVISDYEKMLSSASRFDKSEIKRAIKFYRKINRIDNFFEIELRDSIERSLGFLSDSSSLSKDERHARYKEHRKFDKLLEQKVTRYLCEIVRLRSQIQNYHHHP